MTTSNESSIPGSISNQPTMTEEEFRKWLRQIDRNKDGRISMKELAAGLREAGFNFKWWRAWWAMKKNDMDKSGYIDTESEIRALMEHARKHWGFDTRSNQTSKEITAEVLLKSSRSISSSLKTIDVDDEKSGV